MLKNLLPHLCIILSGMMITFYILDWFNRALALINNNTTKLLILILSVCSILVSAQVIAYNRRK